jgi:hypothetical protein
MTAAPDRIDVRLVERDPADPAPGRLVLLSVHADDEIVQQLELEPDAAIELAEELLSTAVAAKRRPTPSARRCGGCSRDCGREGMGPAHGAGDQDRAPSLGARSGRA